MEAGKIREEAHEAGYAWRTVERAKDDLGIMPSKDQFGGPWTWRLPAGGVCRDTLCHDV
jgi:putative DNA primase/helicase